MFNAGLLDLEMTFSIIGMMIAQNLEAVWICDIEREGGCKVSFFHAHNLK